MSNEEAINELKKYTLGRKNTEKVEISVLQINRVIKALEEEPCEDCISRADVFETYSVLYDVFDDNPNICNELHKVFVRLNKLPSVTPQQKTGHWEWVQYDGNPNIGNLHCSECNRIAGFEYNYCPNCGAKMEEVEE